jgi:hypothetical protein
MEETKENVAAEPVLGQMAYEGVPKPDAHTFTVRCFRWERKARGRGLKKGKAVKRFVGLCSNAESVLAEAKAYCEAANTNPA